MFSRITKNDIIIIMICFKYARAQKISFVVLVAEMRLMHLYWKKKCEFAKSTINFSSIDKIFEKLKREKLKTKIAWKVAVKFARIKQSKLKRLCQQKRFLKKREQKIFEKNCSTWKNWKKLLKLMLRLFRSFFEQVVVSRYSVIWNFQLINFWWYRRNFL